MKSFFEAWRKRTARLLAGSGKVSELAMILAEGSEVDAGEWRKVIEGILDGTRVPDFELLTEIEGVLARPLVLGDGLMQEQDLFL